jgi:hypothetical protein
MFDLLINWWMHGWNKNWEERERRIKLVEERMKRQQQQRKDERKGENH